MQTDASPRSLATVSFTVHLTILAMLTSSPVCFKKPMRGQCDSGMLQDMFDTQAWLSGEYETPAWTLGWGSWQCCHVCSIKVAHEVGPQPQEAELLKMLVVFLVSSKRPLDHCACQCTLMFDSSLAHVHSHVWHVCALVSGSCPAHVHSHA